VKRAVLILLVLLVLGGATAVLAVELGRIQLERGLSKALQVPVRIQRLTYEPGRLTLHGATFHPPAFTASAEGQTVSSIPLTIHRLQLEGSLFSLVLNVSWILYRDKIFSPGRSYKWRRRMNYVFTGICFVGVIYGLMFTNVNPSFGILIILGSFVGLVVCVTLIVIDRKPGDMHLVSQSGEVPSMKQICLRNIFILIPLQFSPGFMCEFARIMLPTLIIRRVFYGMIFLMSFIIYPLLFGSNPALVFLGIVIAGICSGLFFAYDRPLSQTGERLFDDKAKTRVMVKNL